MCLEAKSVKMMILAAAFCVWFVSLPGSGEAAYEPFIMMILVFFRTYCYTNTWV